MTQPLAEALEYLERAQAANDAEERTPGQGWTQETRACLAEAVRRLQVLGGEE